MLPSFWRWGLALLAPLLLLLAASPSPVGAAPGPEASGRWRLMDSPAQFQQFKDAAVQKTLDSMSFAVRAMAGSRVANAVSACGQYDIVLEAAVMRVTCDSKPTVVLNLDGTPSTYSADGTAYTVTAGVRGESVTATFQGPDASQVTVYTFSGTRLSVAKTVNSPHFGEPLRWTNTYQK